MQRMARMSLRFELRQAQERDLPEMLAIYAAEVRHGTASFEIEPPDLDELRRRHAKVAQLGLPWLVAQCPEGIGGYAYATSYRERPAYRFTLEDSVYVADWARGHGLGRAMLAAVIAAAGAAGARQMVAVIGDSANRGSIRLHHACGFVEVGVLRDVGRKFDRWLDTVLMQRTL
jgi:L-amino acid N-acyltransferase YncA